MAEKMKPRQEFLADVNAARKEKGFKRFDTLEDYFTDNGRLKKGSAGYDRRVATFENERGKIQRERIVLSPEFMTKAREIYGSTADLYNIPELKSIFEEAFINEWTPAELVRNIDNTDWAKSRTDAQEKADVQKTVNPVEWNDKVAGNVTVVRRILAGKGLTIGDDQIKQIAEKGTRNGWSDVEWDTYSAADAVAFIGPSKALTGGEKPVAATPTQPTAQPVAPTTTKLRDTAKKFGVPVSDAMLSDWVATITQGVKTEEQFTESMRASAQSLYPALNERLKTEDFDSIAAPYKRLYSDILEVPEDNVDLSSPTGAMAFTGGDPEKPRLMTSTEWVKYLRKRPEWQNTKNAYDEYASAAKVLRNIFGGVR